MESKRINLELYKEAAKVLNKDEWSVFEKKILEVLRAHIPTTHPWDWRNTSSDAEKTLAEIFCFKKGWATLFETAKRHHDLLVKYEQRLLPLQPEFYLKH